MYDLTSIASKRFGNTVEEELRSLGGIVGIIEAVCEYSNQITDYVEEWTALLIGKLGKIERCLRILDVVINNNEANQQFILHYKSKVFVKVLVRFLNLIYTELTLHPTIDEWQNESAGVAIREVLVPLLKVIINLGHPFNEQAIGSVFLGEEKTILQISMHVLLFTPTFVPMRFHFDISALTLVLLSNLLQCNKKNRQSLMLLQVPLEEFGKEQQPAVKSLVEYFYKYEDKMRMIKMPTEDILVNGGDAKQTSQDDATNTLMHNSGSHMEYTVLASVTSILIGFLVMDNPNNEQTLREFLRNGTFSAMVIILKQYYDFLIDTVSSGAYSTSHLETIRIILDYLRGCN